MNPLIKINQPNLDGAKIIAHSSEFYNPCNPVTIYELSTGGNVSQICRNGWLYTWYEGDYRRITETWPLSQSQYQEW